MDKLGLSFIKILDKLDLPQPKGPCNIKLVFNPFLTIDFILGSRIISSIVCGLYFCQKSISLISIVGYINLIYKGLNKIIKLCQ